MMGVLALSTLLLAPGGGVSDDGEEGATGGIQPIQVIDSQHQIRYGDEIHFELQAMSQAAAITEVQAFIKSVGPDTISEYSYAEFDPGEKVSASFSIPTSGASFRPPGTRLDVRYVVRDAEGNEFETPSKRIEYLDPQFDWKRASRGRLTVIYHDRRGSEIDAVLEEAEGRLPMLQRTFGDQSGRSFRAVLVNSAQEAEKAFPLVSETARNQHTFGGFAFDEFGLFVLWGADPRGFVHELTHLVFGQAVSSPLAKKPAWLNEGLAVYFETLDMDATRRRLHAVADREDLFPITSMNAVPGRRDDIAMFYAKAGNFAGFLMEEFGPDAMSRLVAELNLGAKPEDAVKTIYGKSLPELDAEWESRVYGEPRANVDSSGFGQAPATAQPDISKTKAGTDVATPAPVQHTAPGPGDAETNTFPWQIALWLGLPALGMLAIGLIVRMWQRRDQSGISPQ